MFCICFLKHLQEICVGVIMGGANLCQQIVHRSNYLHVCKFFFSMAGGLLFVCLMVASLLSTACSQCPTVCTCSRDLTSVTCQSSSFTDIPDLQGVFGTALTLSLSGNRISTLKENAFRGLTILEQLFLDNNNIETVDKDAFAGLGNLTDLRLNNNKMKSLPKDLFQPVTSLQTLFLQSNLITGLPDGIFAGLTSLRSLNLLNNVLSCDCTTQWLGQWIANNSAIVDQPTMVTCNFPATLSGRHIQNLTSDEFVCKAPLLQQGPSNVTVRTTRQLTLLCDVSGIPRPEFIWTRDDVVIKSDGVRVSVEESGSLIISSVELTDFGRYICNASNLEGYIVSSAAIVIVEESTCFDDLFTNEHESDIDCGGPHCKPCNETQHCLLDRDCGKKLYCMGTHELLSGLLYIEEQHILYGTCVNETKPSTTLAERFKSALIGRDNPLQDLDASADLQTINSHLRDELAIQLNTKKEVLKNVNAMSVKRYGKPLLQIEVELDPSADKVAADKARQQLETNMHEGKIVGTLSLKNGSNRILITL